jgi:hypothetical protein
MKFLKTLTALSMTLLINSVSAMTDSTDTIDPIKAINSFIASKCYNYEIKPICYKLINLTIMGNENRLPLVKIVEPKIADDGLSYSYDEESGEYESINDPIQNHNNSLNSNYSSIFPLYVEFFWPSYYSHSSGGAH